MRSISFLIFISLFTLNASAQEKITLEDIWYSGQFYPSMVKSINSMNDGEHFTSLDSDRKTNSISINKYAYSDYELVNEILNSSNFKPNGETHMLFDDYQFSAD